MAPVPLPLFALLITACAIGTTEFVVSGLLPQVSADLGVDIPTTGLLVSGYAMGVVIGGPIMTVVTARLSRRTALLALVAIFIGANLFCAMSTSFAATLAARVMSAFAHGAYFGIATVVATSLVPDGRRASAIALIGAGVMTANILGVPGGTALGQALGWRATFWAISIAGVVAIASMALWLPKGGSGRAMDVRAEIGALRRGRVLTGLLLLFLHGAGLFGLFTFIAPLLTTVSGFAPAQVPLLLLLFGIGGIVGTLLSGRLADWRLEASIVIVLAAQVLLYVAFVLLAGNAVAAYALVVILGIVGMAAQAPLRALVLSAALDAPSLAATFSSSAFNLGVAVGATSGAAALARGASYSQLPWLGVACGLAGLAVITLAPGPQPARATSEIA
jgi:MFS transporter, DHA1 family, inner membrane transport protein